MTCLLSQPLRTFFKAKMKSCFKNSSFNKPSLFQIPYSHIIFKIIVGSFHSGFQLIANILDADACSSRIFLLGPSHHYYTTKCSLSTATVYQTPVGDLPIDLEGILISILFFENFHFFLNYGLVSHIGFLGLASMKNWDFI